MDTKTEQNKVNETEPVYRPHLRLYHANTKGSGCAVQFELYPAHYSRTGGCVDGCMMVTFANQMTIGSRQNGSYSTFDWRGAIVVKLDFADLTRMLQVLRGECESIENGKGLVHVSANGTASILMKHQLEDREGYAISVKRTLRDRTEKKSYFCLTPYEALGIMTVIEDSLGLICFGCPAELCKYTKKVF